MDDESIDVPQTPDTLARRVGAALVGGILPPAFVLAAFDANQREEFLSIVGSATDPSTLCASLAVLSMPIALRLRAGTLAKALPVILSVAAYFASPLRDVGGFVERLEGLRVEDHPPFTLGIMVYREFLGTTSRACALAAMAAGTYAGASKVAGRGRGGDGGLGTVAFAFALASVAVGVGAAWVAADVATILERPAAVMENRESSANLLGNLCRVLAALFVLGVARSGIVTVGNRGRSLAAAFVLPALVAPFFVDRWFVDRLARADWASDSLQTGFEFARVGRAVPGEVGASGRTLAIIGPAYVILREAGRIPLERDDLAARLVRAAARSSDGGTRGAGAGSPGDERRTLVAIADAALGHDDLRAFVGACEDADYDAVVFLARDAHAPVVGGDSALARLVPPALVEVELRLNPTGSARGAGSRRVRLEAENVQALLGEITNAAARGEPPAVYEVGSGPTAPRRP